MWKLSSFLAGAVVAAAACSDAFKPTTENVIGDYQLLTFTADSAGTSKDMVAAGATMELLLMPTGEVLGMLNVPGDSTLAFASLNGIWTLNGRVIRFDQTWDTFVRDMDWIVDKDRLSADKTFGAVRVRVALKKRPEPQLP